MQHTQGLRRAATILLAGALLAVQLTAAAVFAAPAAPAGAQAAPPPRVDRPVLPELLDPNPARGWGVVGYREQTGIINKSQVWDFAQIGDRVFVAGSFTGVQRNFFGVEAAPPVTNQAFLAAFDVDTNEWISTFRPTFDAPVLALATSTDGKLLVGGAFGTVNGDARRGLAKLDPLTGTVDPTFGATVAQDGASFPALVRELAISGEWLYVAGDFNRIVVGADRNGVFSLGRVRQSNGAFDSGWRPRATGAGVNDVEPEPGRQRVHLAGNFTAVNGSPGTAYQAVVSMVDGSTVTTVTAFENDSVQTWEFGVAVSGDKVWTAGAQHQVQVLDGASRRRIDWYRTGTAATTFNSDGHLYFSGGDFQVIDAIDGFVLAGCHCIRQDYGGLDLGRLHYWSGGNAFSSHSFAIAYDAVTRRPLNFIPALVGTYYGTWAQGSDTNGCLYLGGDYQRAANGLMIGGFARFCRPATVPQALAVAATGSSSVRLSWQPAEFNGSGLSRYRVTRNGAFVGETTGRTFEIGNLPVGVAQTFTVSVVTTEGKVGPAATVTSTLVADTTAPTTPGSVALTTNDVDRVTITWAPASDNVAVAGYLVHRDGRFLAYLPGAAVTTYTDTTVAAGTTYAYELRAQDGAGNNSAPSPVARITVGGRDTVAPTVPTSVRLTTNGSSTVTVAWTPSTDNVGVTGYLVHRNTQFLAYVPGGAAASFTDTTVAAGATFTYEVRAQDAAGNNSQASPVQRITVAPGGVDALPPTIPGSPVARVETVNGAPSVVLTWTASTDNDVVRGYLVHRNGQFLAFVGGGATTYRDTAVAVGTTYAYEIRAQDRSQNNSAPTTPVAVTVR